MNNKLGGGFITFKYRYRKEIIISLIIVLLLGVSVFSYFYFKEDEEDIVITEKKETKKKLKEEVKEKVSVDIKGEVISPGTYTVDISFRVIDVIDKAGGLTENADTSVINLSKKVIDEMVIIIYSKEQVKNFEETKKQEEYLQNKCISPDDNSLRNDACISNSQTNVVSGKVNINTASISELMTLNGIGESRAKDIISYREKNGPFKTIEDIKNVSGIGESTYANIKENITV
ncbi:MAG: helix-hairpin-helix domain-containing protein [Bacilli bacterium]|nr:helix-hairpin-helix domain-containing protein [Bacilli bacterium]MBR6137714.1 helix-hairpin-helix domain-containing protein [Bacilli bacterium]